MSADTGHYYAIHCRHGAPGSEEFATFDEAIHWLDAAADLGECFPIAVYDRPADTVALPDADGLVSDDERLKVIRSAMSLDAAHRFAHQIRFAWAGASL